MTGPTERRLLARAVARMRARIMATSCAVVGGSGLLLATLLHLVRERAASSLDIALLAHYLPGYSVSWQGALLGFVYGAAAGACIGGAFGWCYNRLADGDQ
jgi:hypothetical protein